MNWSNITRNFFFGVFILLFIGFTAVTLFAQVDHSNFIQNYEGAKTCEACHEGSIAELQDTVHYKFQSAVLPDYLYEEDGTPHEIEVSGKLWKFCGFPTTVPQFNWLGNLADDPSTPHIDKPGGCAKCHIGMGGKPFTALGFDSVQESEANNVDCLVCHAEGYSRKFYVAKVNGEPEVVNGNTVVLAVPKVDGEMDYSVFTEAAKTVGQKPKAEYCNRCHAAAGGGKVALDDQEYSFKRGVQFAAEVDVHAAAGMSCAECHSAGQHKTIRNRNNDIYAYDTEPPEQQMCMNCHGETPHMNNPMYDNHVDFVSCTACHSVTNGGAVYKDFADIKPPNPNDPLGLHTARVDQADETFRMEFLWFNGKVKGEIHPMGSRGDGKIYPYKSVVFNQPVDDTGHPVPVKWGAIFKTGNVEKGAELGLASYAALWTPELGARTGLPATPGPMVGYQEGECGYFSLSHAITKENALKCQCCHSDNSVLDFGALGYSEEEQLNLASINIEESCSRVVPSQAAIRSWDVFE